MTVESMVIGGLYVTALEGTCGQTLLTFDEALLFPR